MNFLRACLGLVFLMLATGCVPMENLTKTTEDVKPTGYVQQRMNKGYVESGVYPKDIMKTLAGFDRKSGKMTNENYVTLGEAWGHHMASVAVVEKDINNKHYNLFTYFLLGKDLPANLSFEYFNIHRDMKKSFQHGFRQGYGERNADLVLGVNLKEAARLKALDSAILLMDVYREKVISDALATSQFKREWRRILTETLHTFEEITAEGSPAESMAFLESFPSEYNKELEALLFCLDPKNRNITCDLRPTSRHTEVLTQDDIHKLLYEGYTTREDMKKVLGKDMLYRTVNIHINDEKNHENTFFQFNKSINDNQASPLMISDSNVQNSVLSGGGIVEQINKVSWLFVGQEMGRKFNHNLITRHDLVEWIKRARSIMESKSGENYYLTTIRLVRDGFIHEKGYGPGGEMEWQRIAQEVGLQL